MELCALWEGRERREREREREREKEERESPNYLVLFQCFVYCSAVVEYPFRIVVIDHISYIPCNPEHQPLLVYCSFQFYLTHTYQYNIWLSYYMYVMYIYMYVHPIDVLHIHI